MGLILLLAYQMWGKPSRMYNIEDRRRADLQITLGLLEKYLLGFDCNQGNAVYYNQQYKYCINCECWSLLLCFQSS